MKLTQEAHAFLLTKLREYGNQPSQEHQQALLALVSAMTAMSERRLQGRYAFGLPTGMGKTLSIISWLATAERLGRTYSAAVAASKIEALCQLKRDLIACGVPAAKIGLLHADPDASEPTTADNEDRPIMLVTHARILAGKLETFQTYQDKPRSILFWDESLIASESLFVVSNLLEGSIGFLERAYQGDEDYTDLISWLNACSRCIREEMDRQRETPTEGGGVVQLPPCPQVHAFKDLVGMRQQVLDPVRVLLDLVNRPLRVILSGQRGAVSYQITLPEALSNILVLDASQPIRKLVHLDQTIRDAERVLPLLQSLGTPLAGLKQWSRVTLHQQFAGGGRSTLEKDFAKKYRTDRRVTKSIVEVVRQIPPEDSILIFTYKGLVYGGNSYKDIVLRDLQASGVPMVLPDKKTKRVNVLTWGHEASLNSFSHCRHVILAGVLQRNPVDLAGAYLGQKNNLTAKVNHDTIRELLLSEVCHVVYQALSRGSCRVVTDGQAGEMHGYLIHRDGAIRGELEKVMPGAVWKVWGNKKDSKDGRGSTGCIAQTARQISEYLQRQDKGTALVSSRQVKKDLGLTTVPRQTFTVALHRALLGSGWTLSKQSLVKT
jgi:hypothetical protein